MEKGHRGLLVCSLGKGFEKKHIREFQLFLFDSFLYERHMRFNFGLREVSSKMFSNFYGAAHHLPNPATEEST